MSAHSRASRLPLLLHSRSVSCAVDLRTCARRYLRCGCSIYVLTVLPLVSTQQHNTRRGILATVPIAPLMFFFQDVHAEPTPPASPAQSGGVTSAAGSVMGSPQRPNAAGGGGGGLAAPQQGVGKPGLSPPPLAPDVIAQLPTAAEPGGWPHHDLPASEADGAEQQQRLALASPASLQRGGAWPEETAPLLSPSPQPCAAAQQPPAQHPHPHPHHARAHDSRSHHHSRHRSGPSSFAHCGGGGFGPLSRLLSLGLTKAAIPYLLFANDVVIGLASGMTVQFFPLFFKNQCGFSPVVVSGIYVASPVVRAVVLCCVVLLAPQMYPCISLVQSQRWVGGWVSPARR